MKVLLMHPDRDFDPQSAPPSHEPDLIQDLELDTLERAMTGGDKALAAVVHTALMSALQTDMATVLHRQEILADCLQHPDVVRELHALAVATSEEKRKHFYGIGTLSPRSVLFGAVEILPMLASMLKKLRSIAETQIEQFTSRGFRDLFATLQREFSDDYITEIRHHLKELRFNHGVLLSAELGPGNEGTNYVLRRPRGRPNWFARLFGTGPTSYSFRIDDRDISGSEILSAMHTRGINLVANAVAQAADHIISFFAALRTELAFYVGCLNLRDKLVTKNVPLMLPKPEPAGSRVLHFSGLHDICLILTVNTPVVSNTLNADYKDLLIITGANQGGKSSFLRAIGVAQLMMQCGMYVVADSFGGELSANIFTHHKREEDKTMRHGKLDEEIARMSRIVESITPNSMLFCNESFASTNEREGSEIATQVVRALREIGVKIFFVTHLYEFSRRVFARSSNGVAFLRAERLEDGTRTFKITEGKPMETSFGQDLYDAIFSADHEITRSQTCEIRH